MSGTEDVRSGEDGDGGEFGYDEIETALVNVHTFTHLQKGIGRLSMQGDAGC